MAFLLLAACVAAPTTVMVGRYRPAEAAIYSSAVLEPARMVGRWQQVAGFGATGCPPGAVEIDNTVNGLQVSYQLCQAGGLAQGKGVIEAALAAAHLRFRPIVMTSLAFTLGVLPLAIASGAGSASQRAIGTGVIGGILTGTALAVVFVPIFFVVVRSLFKDSERQHQVHAAQAAHMGVHTDDR